MRDKTSIRIPTEEEVRERAYQKYLDRGREDGHDLEDWLAARFELEQSTERESEIASDPNKSRSAVVSV